HQLQLVEGKQRADDQLYDRREQRDRDQDRRADLRARAPPEAERRAEALPVQREDGVPPAQSSALVVPVPKVVDRTRFVRGARVLGSLVRGRHARTPGASTDSTGVSMRNRSSSVCRRCWMRTSPSPSSTTLSRTRSKGATPSERRNTLCPSVVTSSPAATRRLASGAGSPVTSTSSVSVAAVKAATDP